MPKKTNKKILRIGLLGGTFNPIHLGHLRAAEEIWEKFKLTMVVFIPAKTPPHKQSPEVISASHRLAMVKCAVKGNPHFTVSDLELKRKGKSYSVDTIHHFRKIYKPENQLFFIIGEDAFQEITLWKDYKTIFSLCDWIVMHRSGLAKKDINEIISGELKGCFLESEGDILLHPSNHRVYFTDITHLDISSSLIRERIKKGESIRYLLPEEVERYIKAHQLYKELRKERL